MWPAESAEGPGFPQRPTPLVLRAHLTSAQERGRAARCARGPARLPFPKAPAEPHPGRRRQASPAGPLLDSVPEERIRAATESRTGTSVTATFLRENWKQTWAHVWVGVSGSALGTATQLGGVLQ